MKYGSITTLLSKLGSELKQTSPKAAVVRRLLKKTKNQQRPLFDPTSAFEEGGNQEKPTQYEEEKNTFSTRQGTLIKTITKIHDLLSKLLPYSSYSSDLRPRDLYFFANFKKLLAKKRFGINEELISETEETILIHKIAFFQKVIGSLKNPCVCRLDQRTTFLMRRILKFVDMLRDNIIFGAREIYE